MFYDLDRTKVILKLASPLVLALLLGTAINLVDTIMVGYLPKEYSIAGQSAIGYSIIIHWAIGGFACAISVGTQA
ncbi:MAG: hypothetical protein FJ088_14825, partial [Deltaproteobacteria bacterium]|nr:hypothetical protein [Deltaproteobacteria bacterium]